MPRVYYVKYTDLSGDGNEINDFSFFYTEKQAQKFRDELVKERNERGGPHHSDLYFSEVLGFQYRDICTLISRLNELKDVCP